MIRHKRYERDIRREFDWPEVKRQAIENAQDAEPDESGDRQGLAFLGTTMALTPSGKVYAPWATSNLNPCRHCGGKGWVVNHKGSRDLYRKAEAAVRAARLTAVEVHGPHCNGGWPEGLSESLQVQDDAAERINPQHECNWCNGHGCHEAAQDADWREALEVVADQFDLFVTCGEGDPCDLFAGITLEGGE